MFKADRKQRRKGLVTGGFIKLVFFFFFFFKWQYSQMKWRSTGQSVQTGYKGRESRRKRRNCGTVGIQSSNKDLVKKEQRLKKVSSEFQGDEHRHRHQTS